MPLALSLIFKGVDVMAQRHEILSDNIASLQVVVGDDWLSTDNHAPWGRPYKCKFRRLDP